MIVDAAANLHKRFAAPDARADGGVAADDMIGG
jgi:hypothetical protein